MKMLTYNSLLKNKIVKIILIFNKFNTTINFLNYFGLIKGLIFRDKESSLKTMYRKSDWRLNGLNYNEIGIFFLMTWIIFLIYHHIFS